MKKIIIINLVCLFLIEGISQKGFAEVTISISEGETSPKERLGVTHGVPDFKIVARPETSPYYTYNSKDISDLVMNILILPMKILFSRKEKIMSYRMTISSNDAKNITIYLPFPHYKGRPDKRVLKWLKEDLEYQLNEAKEWRDNVIRRRLEGREYIDGRPIWYWQKMYEERVKFYSEIKLDLIDTEYGKMLH